MAGHPQYTYAPLLISRAALFLTLGALGSTSYSKSSRTSGRHIGKQCPGKPTVVPQNMPGQAASPPRPITSTTSRQNTAQRSASWRPRSTSVSPASLSIPGQEGPAGLLVEARRRDTAPARAILNPQSNQRAKHPAQTYEWVSRPAVPSATAVFPGSL